jgi:hypothetical protein
MNPKMASNPNHSQKLDLEKNMKIEVKVFEFALNILKKYFSG